MMWTLPLTMLGCGTAAPVLLVPPDGVRTGEDGDQGPSGAGVLRTAVAARVTEAVPVTVVYPADEGGGPDSSGGTWPVVVLVQGGLVEADRYLWLATHLATRGYLALLPEHPTDLAITATDNAAAVLRGLRNDPPALLAEEVAPDAPAAVMGHSLGGVVSAMAWVDAPDLFDAVGLFASFPAESTDVAARAGSPALSLIGSMDGSADPAEAAAGAERFGQPVFFGVVEGMNHYDWTDDASRAELSGDFEPSRPQEDTRRDARYVIDTFLDAYLAGRADAEVRLSVGVFPNVSGAP
jgi:dienelactone hydrolase